MRYKDYQVVKFKTIQELNDEMNKAFKFGFVPLGGVAVSNAFYCQAVAIPIKEESINVQKNNEFIRID